MALLRQTKVTDKSPIEYTSRRLNDSKLSQIHHKLCEPDWNGIMNSDDVNTNTEVLLHEINRIMDIEAPLETIRISCKRRFVKPWVTKGLESATKKNRSLYKKTLKDGCTEEDKTLYKKHRNTLNRLHKTTRQQYYKTKLNEYKNNTKKLWSLINQSLKKCKSGGTIIPYITVDGLQTYNPTKVANSFGAFYSTLGKNWLLVLLQEPKTSTTL